jgi:putative transposase
VRKAWNAAKAEAAPWWVACSTEAYATGLDHLATGLEHWSELQAGKADRPSHGLPAFHAHERRAVPSVRFTTGAIRLPDDRQHVTLPSLGTLTTHKSTRKLHRRLAGGDREGDVRDRAPGQGACRKLRRLSRAVSRKQGPDRRTGAQPSKRSCRANDGATRSTTGYTGESPRHPLLPLNEAQSQCVRLVAGSTRPSGSQLIAINRLTV